MILLQPCNCYLLLWINPFQSILSLFTFILVFVEIFNRLPSFLEHFTLPEVISLLLKHRLFVLQFLYLAFELFNIPLLPDPSPPRSLLIGLFFFVLLQRTVRSPRLINF